MWTIAKSSGLFPDKVILMSWQVVSVKLDNMHPSKLSYIQLQWLHASILHYKTKDESSTSMFRAGLTLQEIMRSSWPTLFYAFTEVLKIGFFSVNRYRPIIYKTHTHTQTCTYTCTCTISSAPEW